MIDLSVNEDAVDFFDDVEPFRCSIEEDLDYETLKLIEELEMNAILTNVNETFGSYTESATGYTATFTEVGSSALESISLDEDTLTVSFRNGNSGGSIYTYNATPEAIEPLYTEIVRVLQEGQGSIGRVFNQLVRENKIQLI